MRCSRCGKNNAKHQITYLTGLNRGTEFLCQKCFSADEFRKSSQVQVRPIAVVRCPTCSSTMDDYLQTGLVGCPDCYKTFRESLKTHIQRLQGAENHKGKEPPNAGNYEITLELMNAKKQLKEAEQSEDSLLFGRLQRKVAELDWLLFGDGESDEDEGEE